MQFLAVFFGIWLTIYILGLRSKHSGNQIEKRLFHN